ncbi:MAG: hypothetical protein ACNA8W_08175 [Bradymonadaceae bacterium]
MKRILILIGTLLFCLMGCEGALDDSDGIEAGNDAGVEVETDTVGSEDGGPAVDPGEDVEERPDPAVPCDDNAFDIDIADGLADVTYFVRTDGDDEADGASPQTAFATIQRGLDAMEAGDTLSIGPGEYFGSVRRDGLGNMDVQTTIRAEIPGTVVIRGDVEAPSFRKLEGHQFVYVADFESEHQVQVVNELDTLTVLERKPNFNELEYRAGGFYHDREASKIYISSSDRNPAEVHRYSLSLIPEHGFYMRDAVRVLIDGLTVTGFNTNAMIDRREFVRRTPWGVYLYHGQGNVIRRVHAYLNGRGIAVKSDAEGGQQIIERSLSRGNASQFGENSGGITLFNPKQDIVQDSVSFLNANKGINIRGIGEGDDGSDVAYQSFLRRSLAWGNGLVDFKIKTGMASIHFGEDCVALGVFDNSPNADHCLVGFGGTNLGEDTIVMSREADLDIYEEFANPDGYDYRLQATSRFRGAMADGSDRGPFPYEENIFYVGPEGDDSANGLSVGDAWKSLSRAVENLEAGDTLYLLPGRYTEDVEARLTGTEDEPILIRGRGVEPVIIDGEFSIVDSEHVAVERLSFTRDVNVQRGSALAFSNSIFMGGGSTLTAEAIIGLELTHNMFTGFEEAAISLIESSAVHLSGNLYDNSRGVAVRMDRAESVRYSEYNSYQSALWAWQVGEGVCSIEQGRAHFDKHSKRIIAQIDVDQSVATLLNPGAFAGGRLARPYGNYRDELRKQELKIVTEPSVQSVSATTANIDWGVSLPATTHFAWGPTPDLEHEVEFPALYYANYSLTGLEPDTTYYFRIKSLSIPNNVDIYLDPVEIDGELISFTTASSDPEPKTYYVSPAGDDSQSGLSVDDAWRTIQHAADKVGVGDTVLIGEGTYYELVRIRATGAPGATIKFRNMPGEKVVIDGADRALNNVFIIAAKSHLHLDGFYINDINRRSSFATGPNARWDSWQGGGHGAFNIYESQNITISRMLSDGRGNGKARLIIAHNVRDLHVNNVIATNQFGNALYIVRSPGLRLENSVLVRPQISTILIRNEPGEDSVLSNNIFTDMLDKKAVQNIPLFTLDRSGGREVHEQRNNLYFLRAFPPEERHLYGSSTAFDQPQIFIDPQFGDPDFVGGDILRSMGHDTSFMPDLMTHSYLEYDFDAFMATKPSIVDLGIGLQPEEFVDGHPR